MAVATFDTHRAVRRLEAAGIEPIQAEAIMNEMRDAAGAGRDGLATKADLAGLRTDLAALEGRLYRALWMQGAGIVAVVLAVRLF